MVEVLYFSAPWCSPCRVFGPALEKAGIAKGFGIKKVNVETEPELTREYDVMSLPTTVWFKDGQPMLSKVGPLSDDAIDKVFIHLGA